MTGRNTAVVPIINTNLDANCVIDGTQHNSLSLWSAERDSNHRYSLDEGIFSQPEVMAGICINN